VDKKEVPIPAKIKDAQHGIEILDQVIWLNETFKDVAPRLWDHWFHNYLYLEGAKTVLRNCQDKSVDISGTKIELIVLHYRNWLEKTGYAVPG